MYLNEFQKELINKLIENGNNAINNELTKILDIQEANFSYHPFFYGHVDDRRTTFRFVYRFKAKNQEIQFFTTQGRASNPGLTTNIDLDLKKANREKGIIDEKSEKREIYTKHKELREKEIYMQQAFLNKFQENVEVAIHLMDILANNNLIITYERNLPDDLIFGSQIDDKKFWVESYDIFNFHEGSSDRLFLSLEKFLRTQVIILPGLLEFKQNNFSTFNEMNRKEELKRLKIQTNAVVIGIFISALITLIAAFISHPNASDIKNITDSIQELTIKIDKFEPDTIDLESGVNQSSLPNSMAGN